MRKVTKVWVKNNELAICFCTTIGVISSIAMAHISQNNIDCARYCEIIGVLFSLYLYRRQGILMLNLVHAVL